MTERVNALTAPRPKVSPWAATEIGHSASGNDFSYAKNHFRQEAQEIGTYLTGIHHARKLGHMQVNYGETVSKMSKAQESVALTLKAPAKPPQRVQSKQTAADQQSYSQLMTSMNNTVRQEQGDNYLRRLHNREVGRKAIINDVMAGTAPIPKVELYPQGVTHTQMLAMTGTLAMPTPTVRAYMYTLSLSLSLSLPLVRIC